MTTKFLPAIRIARLCGLLVLATCSVVLHGQSLPYTLDFQSMTVGALPTGLTFIKPTAVTSPGPAVSPPTANSTSGPVGLLVIDSATSPVPAFADPSASPASPNKALRIFDYNTNASGNNQSAFQQVIPTVTSTTTQLSAVSLSFDYQAPVTLTNLSNEYLIIAFGGYTTAQTLNTAANRVIEFRIGNDGTFSYAAATGQNATLSSTTVPTGVNRISLFVNSHNSQVATYTINSVARTLAPNTVDVWNYNYATSTYTQVGSALGLRNTGSYDPGSDAEIGIFGLFAAGSSASGDVDFIVDNFFANTMPLSTPVAPTITTQPANATVAAGSTATFTVVAAGAPTSYQWAKNGTALANGTGASGAVIAGATSATLTVSGAQSTDAGSYTVTATNSIGSATSSAATLTVNAAVPGAPTVTTQPASVSVAAGSSASFSVVASGTSPLSYQWNKGGTAISGAVNATFTIPIAQSTDAASYTVTVTNAAGSTTSNAATLTVTAANNNGRLINLSGRSTVGGGDNTVILGFTFAGSASKSVLLRAVGPTLKQFGVSNAVTDPAFQLFKGSASQASNDNWDGSAATISATAQAGAFPLTSGSLDASLVSTLAPGTYTAAVTAAAGTSGIVLGEVYETTGGLPDSNRFYNFSIRGQVGSGENVLVAGFVVTGGGKHVLIRGVGPTLSTFGFTTALSDPQISVYSGSSAALQNDNWDGSAATTAAFTQAGAFGLSAGSKDAVIIATLQPGVYTVLLTGVGASSGVGMIEIYELP